MKRLFPILAIAVMMAFGSVSATSNTALSTIATTVATTTQDRRSLS